MTTNLDPTTLSPLYLSRGSLLHTKTGEHLPFPVIVSGGEIKCLCIACTPCVSAFEEERVQVAYAKAIGDAVEAAERRLQLLNPNRRRDR